MIIHDFCLKDALFSDTEPQLLHFSFSTQESGDGEETKRSILLYFTCHCMLIHVFVDNKWINSKMFDRNLPKGMQKNHILMQNICICICHITVYKLFSHFELIKI